MHRNFQMTLEQERFDWAMSRLSAAHVRATDARVRVLRCLAEQRLPVTLDDVCAASGVCGRCDPATVWRALDLLEKLQLVRQIRLSDRHSYFALNAPGRCCDYLVCRNCGIVADLPALAPMVELERQLAAARGFEISHHELEIYGTCSDCRRLGKEKYESIKN
jgi:Fe2+ or Zn2+ uptake regulation protein